MIETRKVPPSNIELEEAVLGSLIIESKSYLKVSDMLHIDSFYKNEHQIIYSAIMDLFVSNKPIDMINVVTQLTKSNKLQEVGGAYYISTLTRKIATALHIESHVRELIDLSIKRKLINYSAEINKAGFDQSYNTDDLLKLAANMVDKALNEVNNKSEIKSFDLNLKAAIELIQEKQMSKPETTVKPVLSNLKSIIPDWNTGEVVIIAGRPGMAKTSYALFEIYEQAKLGHAGVFFSLEMQVDRLVSKCIQAETGLTSYDYERPLNPLEWEKIDNCYADYHQLPIFIDEHPGASFEYIKAKSKLLKDRYGIRFIVIDYLQLMDSKKDKNGTREEAVSMISRNMKSLSKELDVTIFVLSQLNRGVESRSDKRPMLADLRESGAIEQDADIVLFPFRPEYYWKEDPELKNQGLIIVAKNRNGDVGDIHMRYNNSVTRFMDYEVEITHESRASAF